MEALIVLLGAFGFIAMFMLLRGLLLSLLWGWFVVPFGVPPIGIAWAIGLSVLMAMLTKEPPGDSSKTANEKLGRTIMFLLLSLFVGAVAHLFM